MLSRWMSVLRILVAQRFGSTIYYFASDPLILEVRIAKRKASSLLFLLRWCEHSLSRRNQKDL